MRLVDLAYHRYFKVFEPSIDTMSFADNLEFHAGEASLIARGWILLLAFCDSWRLDLDFSKSRLLEGIAPLVVALNHYVFPFSRQIGASYFETRPPPNWLTP